MQTIGERLEEARKRKGISVREAAETTKIRGDYLQRFEANTFEIDLPPLYIRGFLRSYARYLELDPERIVNDYNSLLAEGKPVRRETREVYGRVDFAESPRAKEANEPAPANRKGGMDQAVLLKFGLLGGGAVIVVLIVVLLVKVLFTGSSPKPSPSTQSNAVAQNEPTQALTITATDNTRVKLVQDRDEKIVFDGTLNRGESKTFTKVGLMRVTVEDRTKVRVEVNGRRIDIPPLQGGNFGRFMLD